MNIPFKNVNNNNNLGFETDEQIPNYSKKNKEKIINENKSYPKAIVKEDSFEKPEGNFDKEKLTNIKVQNVNNKRFSDSKFSNNKNNLNENKQNQDYKKDESDYSGEKIVLGLNEKKQPIYIPESSRFFNTLVLGNKATGKTTSILPLLLEQDFKNKDYGCTIVVSKNEIAYSLYALAKQYKRDVIMLKPSVSNEIGNKFLWRTDYNYDYINEYIINYKEAIKKRQIVIIDMEILKHKSDGLKAVAMLLLQLQLDMQETDTTQKKPHFLYIDDAQYYLAFLEYLFAFGDNYNLGITLLMQSRSQLIKKNKDYSEMVDNNIRNILLLNSLDKNDISYYKDRLYEYKQSNQFFNRDITEIFYETININNKRKCGIADYKELQNIDWDLIEGKAKTIRSKLLKQKRRELEKELLLSIKSKYEYNEDQKYDNTYNEDNEKNEVNLSADEYKSINSIEKELIESLPAGDFDNYEDIGEPTSIDLKLIDENKNDSLETNAEKLDIKNHVENLKKKSPAVEMSNQEKNKFKEEKIKEIIKIKEKSVKRSVSTKIFNNIISDINYCDDNFDFSFE